MRSLIGGLLGLCLSLAFMPQEASARTDARSSAQSSTSARSTAATRPVATRATPPIQTGRRATAAAPRQALAPRATTSSRTSQSRHAAAVPYARQAALPTRGLRQTAVATCTTRNGRRNCAPAATRTVAMRWTGGLAPAAMSQAGCPDGTIATMAIGHSDITRCVPL